MEICGVVGYVKITLLIAPPLPVNYACCPVSISIFCKYTVVRDTPPTEIREDELWSLWTRNPVRKKDIISLVLQSQGL